MKPLNDSFIKKWANRNQLSHRISRLDNVSIGDSVERGGLATWGINYETLGYQTGEMAMRILEEGADPATMPIETLEKVELIVNLSAAERMGVDIPQSLLDEADAVIE